VVGVVAEFTHQPNHGIANFLFIMTWDLLTLSYSIVKYQKTMTQLMDQSGKWRQRRRYLIVEPAYGRLGSVDICLVSQVTVTSESDSHPNTADEMSTLPSSVESKRQSHEESYVASIRQD